jgi:hypothetical protein
LKEKITTSLATNVLLSHLGQDRQISHVASQKSSILGYQAIVKKYIYFKTFKVP